MIAHMAASLVAPMYSLLIQHVASSLINVISRKEVMRVEKRQKCEFLPILALLQMTKAISGKGVTRGGRGYNNMDHMDKHF